MTVTRGQRGFALLIVLWTLVLVSLLITHMITAAGQETRLAANLRGAAELGAAAEGGVQEAIFHALDKSAGHWVADGTPHIIAGSGRVLEIRILSEAGKVNLNTAPPELLAALLRATGIDRAKAAAITAAVVSWRAPPGEAPPMATEYAEAGRGYAPPNAPFESVGELGDVLGVTPAIVERVAPYLTVHHDGDTDPTVADPIVRAALRDVFGQIPEGTGTLNESMVAITALARQGGNRAERSAIVQIGPTSDGSLYEILEWGTLR